MRGEQLGDALNDIGGKGSPPLARGTACSGSALRVCIGITPACAGNSWSAYHIFNDIRDHPRLRGEQPVRSLLGAQGGGSPPLARGTDSARDGEVIPRRITPACAGNRIVTAMPDGVVRDHPRLRGEQHADPWHKCKRGGSPPLARGTVVVLKSVEVERGITPACAGNRPWRRRQKNEAKDHPRLRGEQFLSFAASLRQMGSPPLARGTVFIKS